MFFMGTDMFEGDGAFATFHALMKTVGDGIVVVKAYASSGMTAKRPYIMTYDWTTESAGAFAFQGVSGDAGYGGLIGIPSAVIASGCVGWVTIRGPVVDASSPASVDFTGSIGHAVFYAGASGLGASSSTYQGAVHQCGILLEDCAGANVTNKATILLTGNEQCTPL